jgi:hypothetical protein
LAPCSTFPAVREKFVKNRSEIRDFVALIEYKSLLINEVRIEPVPFVVCRAGNSSTPETGKNLTRQGISRGILSSHFSGTLIWPRSPSSPVSPPSALRPHAARLSSRVPGTPQERSHSR